MVEISWGVKNYIAMEPLQQKIVSLDTNEQKIVQLLHLARVRGGISDLLKVLTLQILDDEILGSSVTGAMSRLKDEYY